MHKYSEVSTRFLQDHERLILSEEKEMPLVIEACDKKSVDFLRNFLSNNASALIIDIAQYGAVLLRGFEVRSDEEFEQIVLSIPQLR